MRPILTIIALCLSISCLAQFKKKSKAVLKPVIEPEYVEIIGATRAEFAAWAEAKDKWVEGLVEVNNHNVGLDVDVASTYWWDERYTLQGERQVFGRSPWKISYTYYLKDGKVFQVNVKPAEVDGVDFNAELSKYYEFVRQDEGDRYVYRSKDGSYYVVFRDNKVTALLP